MKTFKQFLFEKEELGAAEQKPTPPSPDIVDPKEPLKTRSQFSSDEEYKQYLSDRTTKLSNTIQAHDSADKALGTAVAVGDAVRTGVETGMSVIPGGSQVVAAERAASGAINYAAGNKDAAAEDAVYGVAALVPGGATPLGKAAVGAARETAAGVAGGQDATQVATRALSGAVEGILPGAKSGAGVAATAVTAGVNKYRADSAANKTAEVVSGMQNNSNTPTQKPGQETTTVAYAPTRPTNVNRPRA